MENLLYVIAGVGAGFLLIILIEAYRFIQWHRDNQ